MLNFHPSALVWKLPVLVMTHERVRFVRGQHPTGLVQDYSSLHHLTLFCLVWNTFRLLIEKYDFLGLYIHDVANEFDGLDQ